MLYEAINVWRRTAADGLICYRCFRLVPGGGFCVQSADSFHSSVDATRAGQAERQFLELLSEDAPDKRSRVFPSLEEAISAFDREFGNRLGGAMKVPANRRLQWTGHTGGRVGGLAVSRGKLCQCRV